MSREKKQLLILARAKGLKSPARKLKACRDCLVICAGERCPACSRKHIVEVYWTNKRKRQASEKAKGWWADNPFHSFPDEALLLNKDTRPNYFEQKYGGERKWFRDVLGRN